jgi:signal transduction histidine kinase
VADRVQQAIDDLDVTVRHVRSVIFELQPVTAGDQSVRRDLLAVATEQTRALGFEPVVRFDGPVDTVVDDKLAEDLANVLREALSNVARHAQATRVEVDVTAANEQIELSVTDNGLGIGESPPAGGRGMRNMRNRAESVGGTVTVVPVLSGQGTHLTWRAPTG